MYSTGNWEGYCFFDCAHALGAFTHSKMVGEIADFTDFSLIGGKNVTDNLCRKVVRNRWKMVSA